MAKQVHTKNLKIGDTLRLSLKQTKGDFADVTSVTSSIKPCEVIGEIPDSSVDALFSLSVTPDEETASWYIKLLAVDSANLDEGDYCVDVKIVSSGEVDHTDTVFVRASNSVT